MPENAEEMGKNILLGAEKMAYEKGLSKDEVIEAFETALATAVERQESDIASRVRASIDRITGTLSYYRQWEVVADEDIEDFNRDHHITLKEVNEKSLELKSGDIYEEVIENKVTEKKVNIAAQIARQRLKQKVNEIERSKIAEQYREKVGSMLTGSVKKITLDNLIIDLGDNVDALLRKSNTIGREAYRPGNPVKAVLEKVNDDTKGPLLELTRTSHQMLIEQFKLEVPEIADGVVEICAVAREAGIRSKLAVKSNDGRMDPVGCCVGMRGTRVQSVAEELCDERIDIIKWDEEPAQLVISAFHPVEVQKITLDEDTQRIDIVVPDDQLNQAIGSGGQNVNLVCELSGWAINVLPLSQMLEENEQEINEAVESFTLMLDLEENVAQALAEKGYTSFDKLLYAPAEELKNIAKLDEDGITNLRESAREMVIVQNVGEEESNRKPETLLKHADIKDLNEDDVELLRQNGIITIQNLANMATDDLIDLDIDEELSEDWITYARKTCSMIK